MSSGQIIRHIGGVFNNHMKTNRFTQLIFMAFGFAVFSTVGCTQTKNTAEVPSPPANNAVKNTAITMAPASTATVQVATTAGADVDSARWSGIEDDSFDMRAHFLAALNQMEARVDDQDSALAAKRAAMKSTTDTKD